MTGGIGPDVPEGAGTVDHPFDDDEPGSHPLMRSDAACSIPWRADGYEAILVYVDPAIRERAEDICMTIEGLAGRHADVDTLTGAVLRWTESNQDRLSASVIREPRDAMSEGLLAIAITLG